MTPNQDSETRLAERAQRLYWDSERSVNAIADDLDISKGRLYDIIRPLPVDVACPRCGEPLAWPNRTGRDRGLLVCPSCGLEVEEADDETHLPKASPLPRTTGTLGSGDYGFLMGALAAAVGTGWVVYRLLRRR
ncbi:MAG: hypothetical protein WEA09_10845 [Gemmatimonadota bacterium]